MRACALALAVLIGAATACSSYRGSARAFSPAALESPGWIAVRGVHFLPQDAESDCGAAAIAMVVGYWTGAAPPTLAAALRPAPARGITAGRLRAFARDHGLLAFLIQGQIDDLVHELEHGRPVLVGLVKPQRKGVYTHYEVVVAVHLGQRIVVTLDPAEGWRQNSFDGFRAEWEPASRLTLITSSR